jgi:hypothetical protein
MPNEHELQGPEFVLAGALAHVEKLPHIDPQSPRTEAVRMTGTDAGRPVREQSREQNRAVRLKDV